MNGALLRETASWAFWRLTAAALIVAAVAATASAGSCWDQCDECDLCNSHLSCCYEPPELWLVNTRCVPKCNNLDEGYEHISFKRYDKACGRFVNETRESFLAQEASMPTLIFAHGNTLKHKGAMKQCWEIYGRMRCCPGPKRLVFWSWPAQIAIKRPILRPRKLIMANLRIKYVYSEYQGYYMGKLVSQMSMAQRVTVGGHSYGAIHAAAAAHFLGGGCLRGLTLEGGIPVERPNFRVALVSAAFDNDAMYPGCRFGQAFISAEKVFNTRNPRDSTLDNWPKVSLRGRMALGVTGINPFKLGEYQPKLCQMTTTGDVGKSHYIAPHLESSRFVAALCCFSFPKCCELVAERQNFPSTALAKKNEAKKQALAATVEVKSEEEAPATISAETMIELAPAANAEAAAAAASDGETEAETSADAAEPGIDQDVHFDRAWKSFGPERRAA